MLILRRLHQSLWGAMGFYIVLFYGIIALFAYALAPDNSRYANQMHLSIHSQPPGFSVRMLVIPQVASSPFMERYFSGVSSPDTEMAIVSYRTDKQGLWYIPAIAGGELSGEEQFIRWEDFPVLSDGKAQYYVRDRTFWLGTDKYGRDMLSRMLIGTRISFAIGLVAVCISLFIGVTLGSLAGYYGGRTDALVMWIMNVMWSIPTLLLVIAFTLALGKGHWQIFIAVGLTMWVDVARIVRGQVISVKKNQYIEATHSLGFSDIRIIFRHILPNILAPIIVISAANFASAILIESGLSFLGIGTQPPNPSWGGIIKEHYNYLLLGKPHLSLVPGGAIMSLVMGFMLLSYKLRDLLDVR